MIHNTSRLWHISRKNCSIKAANLHPWAHKKATMIPTTETKDPHNFMWWISPAQPLLLKFNVFVLFLLLYLLWIFVCFVVYQNVYQNGNVFGVVLHVSPCRPRAMKKKFYLLKKIWTQVNKSFLFCFVLFFYIRSDPVFASCSLEVSQLTVMWWTRGLNKEGGVALKPVLCFKDDDDTFIPPTEELFIFQVWQMKTINVSNFYIPLSYQVCILTTNTRTNCSFQFCLISPDHDRHHVKKKLLRPTSRGLFLT